MKVIYLDLETYWSATHSLTKMNPIEYVMHPETEIQSIAVKEQGEQTYVIFGEDNIKGWAKDTDFSNALLVGHNLSGFDSMLLAWRLGIKPKAWGCTLAMARQLGYAKTVGGSLKKVAADLGLGEKLSLEATNTKGKKLADFTAEEAHLMAQYNAVDTDLCAGIFNTLAPKVGMRSLRLIDMTIRMLVEPEFVVDKELLVSTLDEIQTAQQQVLLNVARSVLPEITDVLSDEALAEEARKILASAPKFAKFLEAKGVPVPMKQSPTNPDKMIPALSKTDQEFLDLQEHDDFEVAAAASARLGVKSTILESRIQEFLKVSNCCGGKLPIALSYYGADTTGRWSGTMKMNQQNLPRVNPAKPSPSDALRNCLLAPKGHKVVVADLSGIELRVNHFLWKVPSSMALFKADPAEADLYKDFASKLYNVPVDEVTKAQRQVGKLCLAEGSLVLTDKGLVPIEKVTTRHRVWDGVEWVNHDGVVCNGTREVITYDEVTATPDHIVYLSDGSSCELQEAANKKASLAVTGHGGKAVRLGEANINQDSEGQAPKNTLPMRRLWGKEVGGLTQLKSWANEWVSKMQSTTQDTQVVRRAYNRNEAKMHEPKRRSLEKLWGAWDRVSFRLRTIRWVMDSGESWFAQALGVRQEGQRWALRAGELALGRSQGEWTKQARPTTHGFSYRVSCQTSRDTLRDEHTIKFSGEAYVRSNSEEVSPQVLQTKRRVWDILNAGPRHRFTAEGRLVSNCHLGLGFGAGAKTFKTVAKLMGGVDLTFEESEEVVNKWRSAYPEIVAGWKFSHQALRTIAEGVEGVAIDPWGLCTTMKGGINTPKGAIYYPELRYEKIEDEDKYEWVYGRGTRKARIYAGKIVENIVQHLAREALSAMMLEIQKKYKIVHTVHDEVILIVPEAEAEDALAYMQEVMRRGVDWWPELITWSEGDIADSYGSAK